MIADMTALAIRLTNDGMGDYWDDVDRWVRNHLVERQFVNTDLLTEVAKNPVPASRPGTSKEQLVAENVIPDFLGLFSIFSHINCLAWTKDNTVHALVCCSCNGAQALYYAWESIIRKEDDWIQVNLLLNRASPWVDVDSFLHYTFRGNTLCKIEPEAPTHHYPIYQRKRYLQEKAPVKQVMRYVAPKVLTR